MWLLDSKCSRHMTRDKSKFITLKPRNGGLATFGDDTKKRIIEIGKVGKDSTTSIDKVLLVDGLAYNLLSISQLCNNGYDILFDASKCLIKLKNAIMFVGNRYNNIYQVDLGFITCNEKKYLASHVNDSWLWHRRLGNASMHTLHKISKLDLVKGLPKIAFDKDRLCDACQLGKQTKASFKSKSAIYSCKPFELLHMDLFGPIKILSLSGKKYCLVIVDDYSRFSWTLFLAHKHDAYDCFKSLYKRIMNKIGLNVLSIRSDHGGEFENEWFESFCEERGISHNFSAPRTPQQNGIVERKN
ncbi:Retrovirus-related Pol polyprotein from transposon TNT 1-94 [Apostasia shenzhenica]|uniref:Retrovirus-related Pol polyprotein from transposon TNT 1-94 n=1 Tax=Apostasia shenzhenica TaxID=1088818 RepID=A0A2I0A0B5_9ASPA|nr:Retrovirus-related Pol polyprotein from transposon TNT 1-94 [Apostasia shenzhenica]